MQKWEYHFEYISCLEDISDRKKHLNRIGELGWELVTVSTENDGLDFGAYFKRPIEETSSDF